MKLKKGNRKRTLLVALLVAVLTLGTLLGTLFTAVASTDGEYELTVKFDPTTCNSIRYEIRMGADDPSPIENGTGTLTADNAKISVKNYYYVTLYVIPSTGYDVTDVVYGSADEVEEGHGERPPKMNTTDSDGYPGGKYTFSMPKSATTCKVTFSNKTLAVKFYNDSQYNFSDFDMDGIKDTVDTDDDGDGILDVSDGDNRTMKIVCGSNAGKVLPTPTKGAEDAIQWKIVNSSGMDAGLAPINADGELKIGIPTEDMQKTGEIWLKPIFSSMIYDTTRHDVVFDQDAGEENKYYTVELGNHTWSAIVEDKYNSMLNASSSTQNVTESIKDYPGYELYKGNFKIPEKFTVIAVVPVEDNNSNNLYRYYSPITYTVKFDLNNGTGNSANMNHVFNQDTDLTDRTPTRRGYNFVGWKVTVDDVELDTIVENNKLEADKIEYAAKDGVIHLTAEWEPVAYELNYVHGGGAFTGSYPNKHIYNEKTVVPDSVRPGYTFKGWTVTVDGEVVDTITGGSLTSSKEDYIVDEPDGDGKFVITLTAKWQAETYEVTLNPNIGDTGDYVGNFDDPNLGKYTFGESLENIMLTPLTREGYKFLGYFTMAEGGDCFINADGHGIGTWQKDDGDDSGKVTLYAQWEPLPYNIKLNYDKNLVQSITVNGVPYNDEVIVIKYRTTIEVKILTKDGFKVTKFNGVKDPHAADYTKIYRHEVANDIMELKIEILPALIAPDMKVDFATESVVLANGNPLPKGKYSMLNADGEVFCDFIVEEDGTVKINGKTVRAAVIAEFCYGSSVQVIMRGREGIEADSDTVVIPVPARPEAPDAEYTLSAEQDRIIVTITDGDASKYQFSISTDPLTPGVWQNDPVLTTLADGSALSAETTYYVFIRLKYTETTPGSVPMEPIAFRTTHVIDQVSLILPIVLLGVTLLCQTAAIVFLIMRRRKSPKSDRLYSIAPLPILALTARFVPAIGLPIAAVLAVLVIIAQIVLTYLLLTSDLIRRTPKDERFEEDGDEEESVGSEETEVTDGEEDPTENEPALDTLIDADISDSAYQHDNTYHFVYNEEEGAETEQTSDPLAVYDDADDGDGQDFMEPAADPKYSLENTPDAPEFVFDDEDEEELGDIDDSYLADSDEDEIPDDIDDSKHAE